MFDHKHYVPILKWKRAEQGALKELTDEDKNNMTPLIQFVMPKQKPKEQFDDVVLNFEKQMEKIPGKILEVWGTSPIFIGVSLLYTNELKVKSLESIVRNGYKIGAHFIPVIHLSDEETVKKTAYSLAKKYKSGLCIRLICPDFEDLDELNKKLQNLLKSQNLSAKQVDLLVDIKETKEDDSKYQRFIDLSQKITDLPKWRSFTFAGGSFPEDLTDCKLDDENLIPRLDWINWVSRSGENSLKRKPAFADYTIQHPIYKEASQFFAPTASIKYTLDDKWLIMKGRKQKHEMYLAHAKILSGDDRFYGDDFSYGDKYIAEKAQHYDVYIKNPKVKGTGSTETWLRAGINHHLTLVAHRIANLP